MKQQLVDKSSRIEVVDALRGFAVMAILLVHNLEHFIFPVYPENSPGWLNVLDQGVLNSIFALFAGKAYAIFALLFGFTFYMQSNNQKKQGKDFGYRFLWRLALLGVFATWNAAFFPAGDVLLLFVVVGVVLFLTRSWSDRAIGVAAVVLLLQPVEWYHYIANLINPAHRLPDLKVAEMYGEVADYTKAGNWRDFLLGNVTLGQKASFLWAVNAGRFVQTAGLSIIGAFIYFPIGLNLAPYCGYTLSLSVGFLIFLLQLKFCKWWLARHKQGPLEYIWHKCTWIGTGK